MTGVPPSGSGHSVSDPSPDGLGHTASVPNADLILDIMEKRLPWPRRDMAFIAQEIAAALTNGGRE